jgi:hypothetical protein
LGLSDDTDTIARAVLEQFLFHTAFEHAVRRLQRRQRVNLTNGLELRDIQIRDARIATLLAFLDQLYNRTPRLFDIPVRIRSMDLIKIDDIDIKTPQTRFGLFAYACGIWFAKWRRPAWFPA